MSKVAIVGVEGSGKTVLMASLAECFGSISHDEPYLMPENQAAYLFMNQIPHRLREDREWPSATGIDALRTMKWTLRSGQTVLQTIEMLDYPGELYRLAFGERTAEEVAAHRAELDEFLEHLTDADTLIVLFNLADVENQGSDARNAETVWITRGIFDYAAKLPNLKRRHLVFTQADRYAAALKEAGGAEGLYAKKLPMLKMLHPNLPVTALAAVDGMDDAGRPKPGYSSQGCKEVMRAILNEQDSNARASLQYCQSKQEKIILLDWISFEDFQSRVTKLETALKQLNHVALPVKAFYKEEIQFLEAQAEYWSDLLSDAKTVVTANTIEQLALPETWALLHGKYADAVQVSDAFQKIYQAKAERTKQQAEVVEAGQSKKSKVNDAHSERTTFNRYVYGICLLLLVGGIVLWYGKHAVKKSEMATTDATVKQEEASIATTEKVTAELKAAEAAKIAATTSSIAKTKTEEYQKASTMLQALKKKKTDADRRSLMAERSLSDSEWRAAYWVEQTASDPTVSSWAAEAQKESRISSANANELERAKAETKEMTEAVEKASANAIRLYDEMSVANSSALEAEKLAAEARMEAARAAKKAKAALEMARSAKDRALAAKERARW